MQVGDIVLEVSAVTLTAGKEGLYAQNGYGDRPFDNFNRSMMDCVGQDFDTVMNVRPCLALLLAVLRSVPVAAPCGACPRVQGVHFPPPRSCTYHDFCAWCAGDRQQQRALGLPGRRAHRPPPQLGLSPPSHRHGTSLRPRRSAIAHGGLDGAAHAGCWTPVPSQAHTHAAQAGEFLQWKIRTQRSTLAQ